MTKGTNSPIRPDKIPNIRNIVKITAIVFGNFNFFLKKTMIGLATKDKIPAITIYMMTDRIANKKDPKKRIPTTIVSALRIPFVIIFEFISYILLRFP